MASQIQKSTRLGAFLFWILLSAGMQLKYRSRLVGELICKHLVLAQVCCGTWTRTKIFSSRGRRPTIRRSRNKQNKNTTKMPIFKGKSRKNFML